MNMNNTNWKILAILGIGGIVLTGVGTFAATSTATQSEVLNTRRPQMMKEFWTWNLKELKNPHVQMNNLLTNLKTILWKLKGSYYRNRKNCIARKMGNK